MAHVIENDQLAELFHGVIVQCLGFPQFYRQILTAMHDEPRFAQSPRCPGDIEFRAMPLDILKESDSQPQRTHGRILRERKESILAPRIFLVETPPVKRGNGRPCRKRVNAVVDGCMDNRYSSAPGVPYQTDTPAVAQPASDLLIAYSVDNAAKILQFPCERIGGEPVEPGDAIIVPFNSAQRKVECKNCESFCRERGSCVRKKTPILEGHETMANDKKGKIMPAVGKPEFTENRIAVPILHLKAQDGDSVLVHGIPKYKIIRR